MYTNMTISQKSVFAALSVKSMHNLGVICAKCRYITEFMRITCFHTRDYLRSPIIMNIQYRAVHRVMTIDF